jgi:hypothetical protein
MPDQMPVDTTATASDMADAMFGDGIQIVSATYTGAESASGIYSNGDTASPDLTPSDTGVILSTGKAADITNGNADSNTSSWLTTVHQTAGDDDLTSVSGQTTYDASVLEAEFIPEGSTLTMQVVFSSRCLSKKLSADFMRRL